MVFAQNIENAKYRNAIFRTIITGAGIVAIFLLVEYRGLACSSSCLVKSLTGLPCLGCGGLGAFQSLLAGNLFNSFSSNPMLLCLMITSVYWCLEPLIPQAQASQRFEKGLIALIICSLIILMLRPLF